VDETAFLTLFTGEPPKRKKVMMLDTALTSLTGAALTSLTGNNVALTVDSISDVEIVCASAVQGVTITATTIRRVTIRSAPGCAIGAGGLTVTASNAEDFLVYVNSSDDSPDSSLRVILPIEAKNVALRGYGSWGCWAVGAPSSHGVIFYRLPDRYGFADVHAYLSYAVPDLTGVPLLPATMPSEAVTFWSKIFCDVITDYASPTTDTFVVSGPVLATLQRAVRAASIGPSEDQLSGDNSTALTSGGGSGVVRGLAVNVPPTAALQRDDAMRYDVEVSGGGSATFTYAEILAAARAWYSAIPTITIKYVWGRKPQPLQPQPLLLLPPVTVEGNDKEASI
jgi:hypothetical protein